MERWQGNIIRNPLPVEHQGMQDLGSRTLRSHTKLRFPNTTKIQTTSWVPLAKSIAELPIIRILDEIVNESLQKITTCQILFVLLECVSRSKRSRAKRLVVLLTFPTTTTTTYKNLCLTLYVLCKTLIVKTHNRTTMSYGNDKGRIGIHCERLSEQTFLTWHKSQHTPQSSSAKLFCRGWRTGHTQSCGTYNKAFTSTEKRQNWAPNLTLGITIGTENRPFPKRYCRMDQMARCIQNMLFKVTSRWNMHHL